MSTHGSRTCYKAGCRRTPCRSANANYEQRRAAQAYARGPANGLVCPETARTKLEKPARIGIGHRQAARLAGVSFRTIQRIRQGHARTIRVRVERAILQIARPALARGVYVNGYETRHYVESLVREGFRKTDLAWRLGRRYGRVRIGQNVRVVTALKVRALHAQLTAEEAGG